MNDADDMTMIYNTLVQLRYPHITNAESKDVETTILSGENRVCLLLWFLTEKLPFVTTQLEKRGDVALEDKLFEYYSKLGICNNKDLLLGKCALKEQLPMLRLLLDFMRKVYVESVEEFSPNKAKKETLMDIIKLYTNDINQTSLLPIAKTKTNYAEAVKYFRECERELLSDSCNDTKPNLPQNTCTIAETDDQLLNEDQDRLFDNEKEKFIEAFQTISSWPIQPRDLDKDITDSIFSDVKSICSDFSALRKVLQASSEIANVDLSKKLPETTTPLNAIIEDIVIHNEDLENLNMINDNV